LTLIKALSCNKLNMKTFESSHQVHVSYNIYGDPKSKNAILFFHGFPGSHLQGAFLNHELQGQNAIMVAVDRPGYGNSSWVAPQKKWHLAVQAYAELMTSLGLEKISVMGVSGGAPMAHMTASTLSDRVQQLIVICGLASFSKVNRPTFSTNQKRLLGLAKFFPTAFLRFIMDKGMSSFQPEKRLQNLMRSLHDTDREVLTDSRNQDLLLESMRWARNQGSRGIVWDSQIFSQDWLHQFCDMSQFEKFPTLYIHGEKDFLLNPKMSQMMQQWVPRSSLKIVEQQGHYSLPLIEQKRILEALVSSKKS
jgi:pimeloyl-ACP methyl ester carboxylesterase